MNTRTLLILFGVAAAAAQSHAQRGPTPGSVPIQNSDRAPMPSSPFQPDLTPGYVLFEGDIQIRTDEYLRILNGPGDGTFGGISNGMTVVFWPGVVPYDFVTAGGGAVSAANQTAAINAMNTIAAIAGINFRPATGSEDRIQFQNSTFNNSPIGRRGGTQTINIFNWGTQIILCHEIYHSLGFWHEQSRSIRGTYITINAANICGAGGTTACTAGTGAGQCCLCVDNAGVCIPCAFNFALDTTPSGYGWYDFDSFMHYGPTAFSCNGQNTITVNAAWNAQWQSVIGQRTHFSWLDTVTCRGLYPFAGDRWLDANNFGPQNGNFRQPWNMTFLNAAAFTPVNGTLFLNPGTYSATGTVYNSPMFVNAPLGGVTLN